MITKILLFFFTVYKNEWRQNEFQRQKKIKKGTFTKENKKIFNIDDIDVNEILVSKKNHMAKILHLYTLLDIMIMMLLDHYV